MSTKAVQLSRQSYRALRRFAGASRANVAIIFALSLIPIMFAGGVAIDLSRALIVRERLGHTLDAAALAVGSKPGLTDQERQAMVNEFVKANYPANKFGTPGKITVTSNNLGVTANASASVPTTILGMFGYDQVSVAADVAVVRSLTGLEVVLVLDTTGSMSGNKIKALKDAATNLVNILFGDETKPDLLKIGIVPFAAAVNIGTASLTKGWIDDKAKSDIAGENFTVKVTNVVTLYSQLKSFSWNGCVEERKPPYDISDDAPTTSTPNTLWLPYFAPDEPDSGGTYDNNYLKDGVSGSVDKRQRNAAKYNGAKITTSPEGPLYGCATSAITPLTNNKATLLSAITALNADGYTHIPVGLAWGRRVISSGAPFTEGAAYDNPAWRKAVILMTDGENTIDDMSNHNKSTYSAYGYLANARLGTTSASSFVTKLNTNQTQLCKELKDKGVEVYTVGFQISSSTIKGLLKGCATSDANYFDSPTAAELKSAFEAIANALSNLRLSH